MPDGPAGDNRSGLTYAAAGVNIDAAEKAVDAIRDLVASTTDRPGPLGGIGGFGGLFALPEGYRQPVLVASTDGVGTKMAVATATGRFETVGIDLVAMCVDDLVCCGAQPLFFLDYQLLGRIEPAQVRAIMTGIAAGCREAGCAIIGGELAEHPGLLQPGEVDVAGFAVGVVERTSIVDGPAHVAPGDALVGLLSPGLRSNGYSLARKAVAHRSLDGPAWSGAGTTLADELLRPSVIYAPCVLSLLEWLDVHAVAHITGGGLPGNLARVLPPSVDAVVDTSRWERPRIFDEVQTSGTVTEEEMRRVFNLGIGMVLVVPASLADDAVAAAGAAGREAAVVGRVEEGRGLVRIV